MAGNMQFGKLVRKLREEKAQTDPKFTLRKFAEAVGISAPFLSRVERGEFDPPAADKIKRMAEILGANVDEFLKIAKKDDPALSEIVREQPAIPDLLRSISGRSESEIRKIIEGLQKNPKGQDDKN